MIVDRTCEYYTTHTPLDAGPALVPILQQLITVTTATPYLTHNLSHLRATTEEPRPEIPERKALIEPLSERELEVLRLIAAGLSNREIAETLVIAFSTAKNHVRSIYGKFQVHSRTQAVARAGELGLL